MTKPKRRTPTSAAPDGDTTMTVALEPGAKKGGRAVRLPGGKHPPGMFWEQPARNRRN